MKQWLSRQAIWQAHLPPPKHVDGPHYEVMIPNEVHQSDIYMKISTCTFSRELMSLADIKSPDP